MFDNLPELTQQFPIGTKIRMSNKDRDDYVQGKFVVEGYLYTKDGLWYPAHQIASGDWEVYTE